MDSLYPKPSLLLKFEDVLKKWNISRRLDGNYRNSKIRFIDGDLTIHGNLNLDSEYLDNDIRGIAVKGDLIVKGNILNCSGDSGPFLTVGGITRARNLIAGGSEIDLQSVTFIEQTVLAHYNHGSLRIAKLIAPLCISDDHSTYIPDISGINVYLTNTFGFEYVDPRTVLSKEVFHYRGKGNFSIRTAPLMRKIIRGENYLR